MVNTMTEADTNMKANGKITCLMAKAKQSMLMEVDTTVNF